MKAVFAAVVLAALLVVACGGGDQDTAPVETSKVTMAKSYKFEPSVIRVEAGTDVSWTNEDNFPHNVHLLDGPDVSKNVPIGDSISIAFDEAGEFDYECSLHPQQMQGKIVVTE